MERGPRKPIISKEMRVINYNRMDDDGHIYQIPEDMLGDFDALVQNIENASFMTEEEEVAISDFRAAFSQYRVG